MFQENHKKMHCFYSENMDNWVVHINIGTLAFLKILWDRESKSWRINITFLSQVLLILHFKIYYLLKNIFTFYLFFNNYLKKAAKLSPIIIDTLIIDLLFPLAIHIVFNFVRNII